MKTLNTTAPRFTPVCLALVAIGAILAGVGTWISFVPPDQEPASVTVAGDHDTLAACISRALQNLPGLSPPPDRGGTAPLVSVLSHPGSKATRIMYDGPSRLSFVVTLTEESHDRTKARVLTLPPFDPGPLVKKAAQGCAEKDSGASAVPKH